MKTYFNIRYEFDRDSVHDHIARRLEGEGSDYICVSDGVVLSCASRNPEYRDAVNGGMFSVCDSGYVPLYIRLLYGERYGQYCGSDIFRDIVSSCRYRMMFMGSSKRVLDGLRKNIAEWNPDVADMRFVELPFLPVEEFDYPAIARMIEADGADIVFVALGAPKQERFMHMLKPHLHHGVMIAVGAVFKFFSGVDSARAPEWVVRHRLEFLYRIRREPRKQLRRCAMIVATLPGLLLGEWRRKRKYCKSASGQ